MATRKVSLRPIVTQIHKTARAAQKAKKTATKAHVKTLDTKLRKLARIELSIRSLCRAFYL